MLAARNWPILIAAVVIVAAVAGYFALSPASTTPARAAAAGTTSAPPAPDRLIGAPQPGAPEANPARGGSNCYQRPSLPEKATALDLTGDDIAYGSLDRGKLPSGWQLVPQHAGSATNAAASGYQPLDALASVMRSAKERSGVRFVKDTSLIEQNVAAATNAHAVITAFANATSQCGTSTQPAATVRPIPVARAGDGSVAIELDVRTAAGIAPLYVAVVQAGPAISTLYLTGKDATSPAMLNSLVTAAATHIETLGKP